LRAGSRPSGPVIAPFHDRKAFGSHVQCRIIHLHVHSAYSLLKGSIKIAKLGELAKADHQPALALTDTDNMFGALEFSDKMAGYGIQPIVGLELAVDFRRPRPQCTQRAGVSAVADRAAGRARTRLFAA